MSPQGALSTTKCLRQNRSFFEETPAHSSLDWHHAPTTQYVITLSGGLEFVTRGGESFIIHPGEILVAADTTGSGHKWRLIDDQAWKRLYVACKEGSKVNSRPDWYARLQTS
jgi:hypothetical protein